MYLSRVNLKDLDFRKKQTFVKAMHHMGHVTKFLQIFRNNLRPHEKRYRFEILEN